MLVTLTDKPIAPLENDDSKIDLGAELIFHGRVRNSEEGQSIKGIFYEHYPKMAENELKKLAEQTLGKFQIAELQCIHRVGFVPNGEMSLRVVIWSKHRVEGLEAMAWFISELKKHVPIWKKVIEN